MKMRSKKRFTISALVLCISVFLMQTAVYAKDVTDQEAPTVKAELYGDTLHIEAVDDTGVDAVFINGRRVNYRVNNALDVNLSDYTDTQDDAVSVYAVDFSGNRSKEQVVRRTVNSGVSDDEEDTVSSENPKAFTPKGQASVTDNATDEDGKEFYTFTTSDDHVFYLIIDKERDSDNVYFLNVVTEQDLLALAEDGEEVGVKNSKTEVCTCIDKCKEGDVDTLCQVCKNDLRSCIGKEDETDKESEKNKDKGSGVGMIFVLLAAAAVCAAGYYFKIYKPKCELDDAEDLDDLFDDEEYESEEDEDKENVSDYESLENAYKETGAALYDDYPDDEVKTE